MDYDTHQDHNNSNPVCVHVWVCVYALWTGIVCYPFKIFAFVFVCSDFCLFSVSLFTLDFRHTVKWIRITFKRIRAIDGWKTSIKIDTERNEWTKNPFANKQAYTHTHTHTHRFEELRKLSEIKTDLFFIFANIYTFGLSRINTLFLHCLQPFHIGIPPIFEFMSTIVWSCDALNTKIVCVLFTLWNNNNIDSSSSSNNSSYNNNNNNNKNKNTTR